MDGIGFEEVLDLYIKYLLAEGAFWFPIAFAAIILPLAFRVMRDYFESKKGGKK